MMIPKLILTILLLPSLCFASPSMIMQQMAVVARANAGGGVTCTASTGGVDNDEVGDPNVEANNQNITVGASWCERTTADCTGNLGTAYSYHVNTDDATIKVAVYTDDGVGDPDSGNELVGVSGSMNSTANEWDSDAAISGAVTASGNYMICIFSSAGSTSNWRIKGGNTSNVYIKNGSGDYATPPATLAGTWSTPNTYGPLSVFVGIE